MDNSNKIVILGGMGPQASAKLHELVVNKSGAFITGAPDQYPYILHASIPIPDFISSKENEVKAVDLIRQALAQTNAETARSICIACNTAHLLLERLGLDAANFVSMVKAVTEEVKTTGSKKVGLLASPNTIHSRLYHDLLEANGQIVLIPNKRELSALEDIIRKVIEGSAALPMLRVRLNLLANNLIAKGADCIVLGCTELPIVGVNVDVPVIDSLDALANKLLERHFAVQD